MEGRLAGKVAVVVGAGSGIGMAVAQRFANEGATVAACDVSEAVREVAADLPGDASAHVFDASDPSAVADFYSTLEDQGRLPTVICNSAGIVGRGGRLADVDVESFDRVMSVNVRGVFLSMKYGIPLMIRAGGGSILNMASIASLVAQPEGTEYTTSKGAVLQLTRSAAIEYSRDGIRVNAICPGTIDTPILSKLPPGMRERLESIQPVGRLGRPEEIAALCAFLASDECTFATGAPFIVDGGRTIS
jgi:NAD(P)-dependent dehydrogenase (short-subunit alcohol dehydrogenase family)